MLFTPHVSTERKDFQTHLIYADLLAQLSQDLSVSCSLTPLLKRAKLDDLRTKQKLIDLTRKSISDELEIVKFDKEYSTSSVLWLPIKTYYLIYHQLCLIDYILTGELSSMTIKHGKCTDTFSKRLTDKTFQFSQPFFNAVCSRKILDFKTVSGEHLRLISSEKRTYGLIMKKVAKEKINNHKITWGILHERSAENKAAVEKYKNTMTVSIFDFFYLMRLRMNYRNSDFIDDIPSEDTKKYFLRYYTSADNFYKCLDALMKELITKLPV